MTDRTTTAVDSTGRTWTVRLRFRDFNAWVVVSSPSRLPSDGPGPLPSGTYTTGTLCSNGKSNDGRDPLAVFEREVALRTGKAVG